MRKLNLNTASMTLSAKLSNKYAEMETKDLLHLLSTARMEHDEAVIFATEFEKRFPSPIGAIRLQ